MKCKFYLKSPNNANNRCLNPNCKLKKCWFSDPLNECESFEPEIIEYGGSDVCKEEDEFYKKYCRWCSSLVCTGVRDTVAREGCKHYQYEMKRELNSLKIEDSIQSSAIELPKYTAKINIGDWEINLTNKTFTGEQIKNMKEMLGWEVKNL